MLPFCHNTNLLVRLRRNVFSVGYETNLVLFFEGIHNRRDRYGTPLQSRTYGGKQMRHLIKKMAPYLGAMAFFIAFSLKVPFFLLVNFFLEQFLAMVM